MLYFLSELFEFSRKFPEIIMISGMIQYREINTSEIIFAFPASILKFFYNFVSQYFCYILALSNIISKIYTFFKITLIT